LKKGFVLYLDYWQHLELLTVLERGELITALFMYETTGAIPELNSNLKMAFSFIRAQLDRDTAKYEAICERNRVNGEKGGRPKTQSNPE
jgi:hypothetical protein